MDWIFEPWKWYVSGPLIGVIMLLARVFGKRFGISSTYRAVCSISGAGEKIKYFNYDWKQHTWMLLMGLGSIIGGYIATNYLSGENMIELSEATKSNLIQYGFSNFETDYIPKEVFTFSNLFSLKGFSMIILGGFLVGFGSRYAGGCTSGNGISGISELQVTSLLAVIGFFIGGIIVTQFVLPLIF